MVSQPDGGSITFQQVSRPAVVQTRSQSVVPLTAEELAVQARQEGKISEVISLSATVYEGGLTLLHCVVGDRAELRAMSKVDFRLFNGVGTVETESKVYSLVMVVGTEPSDAFPSERITLAQQLSANQAAAFALMDESEPLTPGKQEVVEALQALHDHVEANGVRLTQLHAQRVAEAEAREIMRQNAPPPPPKHTVIQFWKLPSGKSASRGGNPTTPSSGGVVKP